MNHDFYNNKSPSGTLFVDYRNDYALDENVIIYGHNMKNDTMFQNLEKFKKEEFFNDDNKIRIYMDGKEYVYEVFSVYVIDGSNTYIKTEFGDNSQYNIYLKQAKNKSLYTYKNTVEHTDKIITLSTCSYEFNNARTVVHAKLID